MGSRKSEKLRGLALVLALLVSGWSATGRAMCDDIISFNRDIRPLLSNHCFQCHGPDEGQRQGGLRLDLEQTARRGGESGPVLVPGQPSQSELVRRLHSADPEERMPPGKTGKPLTKARIALLERWIAAGAPYESHWAFVTPTRPALPAGTREMHPVDAFIRARLTREGLPHAPEAPREVLLRRVTLDLTGLPPTLAEVDAFLADTSPNAYEKVVERLLASPHYGERMALAWLDFARYADSNGFQTDSSRQMWAWRDGVIDAYNRNLPFDQFTLEQLAGDLLPNPTLEQRVATGFHRNTRLNGEGGRIAEEWFAETVIDRVETTGLTWMGLTLNCCRCHDHKYDPITQKEFYQLFAFFNSIQESGVLDSEGGNRGGGNSRPVVALPTPSQKLELERRRLAIQAAEKQKTEALASAPKRQIAWESEFLAKIKNNTNTWQLLQPTVVKSLGGAQLTRQSDDTWLASGPNPTHDTYEIVAPLAQGTFSGLLLEAFPDPSLPNQSLGRYENGNFVLTDVDAEILAPGQSAPMEAHFTRAESDYDQPGWPVRSIVAGKPAKRRRGPNRVGWAVDGPTRREPRKALFVAAVPVTVPANAKVRVTLRHDAIGGHNIGRFRLSATSMPPATLGLKGEELTPTLRAALAMRLEKRTPAQRQQVATFFRTQGDELLLTAENNLRQAKRAMEEYEDTIPTAMVMEEAPKPRDAFLLVRGEYDRPGPKVERAVPAVLPALPDDAPNNRLGLARWLVARQHPLTARVWVNRAWEHFFGIGLVRTSENLGSQAEFPSHPELLDWLAVEFMEPSFAARWAGQPERPWDMKRLHRFLVMSATYRQAATGPALVWERDPENRLLARGPRFRLPAEIARDQALAMSGLMVSKIGGPSARPYMPAGVWDETSRYGDLRGYKPDVGEGLYRRGLYTIWKRTAAPPSMLLFDAPNREVCTVKRSRTNTPLQALALLNETTYVEAARKLGERMIAEGGDTAESRLAHGFRLATGRRPAPEELRVLVEGLAEDLVRFRGNPAAAKQLLATGAAPIDAKLDSADLAAFALAANVLLNLDEVITRE